MRQGWALWTLLCMILCVLGVSGGLIFDDHFQAASGFAWGLWAWRSGRLVLQLDTPVPRG